MPAAPPITVHLLPQKTCWGCGAPATVSIRTLSARHHRFYCHSCGTLVLAGKKEEEPPRR